MKTTTIKLETIQTEIPIFDFTRERNSKHKDYQYIAILKNYVTSKNIEREFQEKVGEYIEDSFMVNTNFIRQIFIKGLVLELGVNKSCSWKYSNVSKTYILLLELREDEIDVIYFDTPFKAFKHKQLLEDTVNTRELLMEKTN